MAFDVFGLRDSVVREYREYFESFVNIRDERIEEFVKDLLDKGEAWPDAVLQLNPAFVKGASLGELAAQGVIAPETARFFGPDFRLHKHQEEALRIALKEESYVVTTGTGSGKSWTYLIPLADHVFRNNPGNHSVRAVIVYPMNALINSQLKALETLRDDHWTDTSLRFARYTGQENDEARDLVQQDPPHILLTNYMMLEYMLVRPAERALLARTTKDLRFLVVDEMHMYRGRQGADVAMLLRRVNEKATQGVPRKLMFIGTSATIATGAQREERNEKIALVASTLFGTEVKAENVVGETLERIASSEFRVQSSEARPSSELGVQSSKAGTGSEFGVQSSEGTLGLAQAVTLPSPAPNAEEVQSHPLTAWIEKTFGVDEVDGELVRQRPTTFREGVAKLVDESGLPETICEDALKATLNAGNQATLPSGDPVFAFRLHQFLASGRTVYASIEPADDRELTVTAQYWAPGEEKKLLFPMAFCRECGQEYYLASWMRHPRPYSLARLSSPAAKTPHPARPVTSPSIARTCGQAKRTFPIPGLTFSGRARG
jgi:DEAD/DEAH box helicase